MGPFGSGSPIIRAGPPGAETRPTTSRPVVEQAVRGHNLTPLTRVRSPRDGHGPGRERSGSVRVHRRVQRGRIHPTPEGPARFVARRPRVLHLGTRLHHHGHAFVCAQELQGLQQRRLRRQGSRSSSLLAAQSRAGPRLSESRSGETEGSIPTTNSAQPAERPRPQHDSLMFGTRNPASGRSQRRLHPHSRFARRAAPKELRRRPHAKQS